MQPQDKHILSFLLSSDLFSSFLICSYFVSTSVDVAPEKPDRPDAAAAGPARDNAGTLTILAEEEEAEEEEEREESEGGSEEAANENGEEGEEEDEDEERALEGVAQWNPRAKPKSPSCANHWPEEAREEKRMLPEWKRGKKQKKIREERKHGKRTGCCLTMDEKNENHTKQRGRQREEGVAQWHPRAKPKSPSWANHWLTRSSARREENIAWGEKRRKQSKGKEDEREAEGEGTDLPDRWQTGKPNKT